jgi:hypothetical protein
MSTLDERKYESAERWAPGAEYAECQLELRNFRALRSHAIHARTFIVIVLLYCTPNKLRLRGVACYDHEDLLRVNY